MTEGTLIAESFEIRIGGHTVSVTDGDIQNVARSCGRAGGQWLPPPLAGLVTYTRE